jgi:hypothetical protein
VLGLRPAHLHAFYVSDTVQLAQSLLDAIGQAQELSTVTVASHATAARLVRKCFCSAFRIEWRVVFRNVGCKVVSWKTVAPAYIRCIGAVALECLTAPWSFRRDLPLTFDRFAWLMTFADRIGATLADGVADSRICRTA